MAQAGDKLYVIVHAYHHFLVEVVEMLGPRRARVTNVVKIHTCQRGWTDFFLDGCMSDTNLMHFPDSDDMSWICEFKWDHEIPKHPRKNHAAERRI